MKSIGCTIILHGAGGIGKKCYRSVFPPRLRVPCAKCVPVQFWGPQRRPGHPGLMERDLEGCAVRLRRKTRQRPSLGLVYFSTLYGLGLAVEKG
jgi:hypothetical protein